MNQIITLQNNETMDLKSIVFNKRKSIKRAIARFLYLNKLDVTEDNFEILVRRTQDNGYKSGVKFLVNYFRNLNYNNYRIKQLLFLFSIEYNTELYCKVFPEANKVLERILYNEKTPEDDKFFKETLFDIVKANKLQVQIIDKFLND